MNKLYHYLLLLLILIFGSTAFGQHNTGVITLTPADTTICPNQTITLHAGFASDFGDITQDDVFSNQVIDMGFDFVYFGNTYRKCVISANNFISFDTTLAGQYSSWVYNAGNKQNTQLGNAILFPYHDINMGLNQGKISFQTFGRAPNRVFVVEFCKCPLFSCNSALVSDQLILYETTNIIEHHIGAKPVCTGWQQGTAIQGLIGNNGANEIFVTGRGTPNVPWTAYLDGRRFTPNGVNTYLIDSIAYNPWVIIPDVDSNDVIWYRQGSPIPIGTGAQVTVTPNGNINYYVAEITGQNGCLGTSTYSFFDTVWIHYGTAYDTTQVSVCAGESYNWFGRELVKAGAYDTILKTTMGCDSFLRLNFSINPLPDVTLKGSTDVQLCEKSSTLLKLAIPSSENTYQWFYNDNAIPGETSAQLSVDKAGTYYVVATTSKGCSSTSLTFNVTVNANPEAKIMPPKNEIACAYDTIEIKALANANIRDYWWTPEKPFRVVNGAEGSSVKGVFTEPTWVTLTVYNKYGCYDTASILIATKPCCEIFVPNAFSPNGDTKNDYFMPNLQNGQILISLQIFDRYGKMVYNNKNPKLGWDGKYDNGQEASSDTYMYFMKYTCADGKIYEKKDNVTLVR